MKQEKTNLRYKEDNDIFGMRERQNETIKMQKFQRNEKSQAEKLESSMREKSPFINGRRQDNFIPPHFKSQFSIGVEDPEEQKNSRNNDRKKLNRFASVDDKNKDKDNTNIDTRYFKKKVIENNNYDKSDPNDDNLICSNCLNQSTAAEVIFKNSIRKDINNGKEGGNLLDRHEMTNSITKSQILSQVEVREAKSQLVSRAVMKINNNNQEKDNLIKINENKTFYLHEVHEDLLKAKTLAKFNQKELSLSSSTKFIQNGKPEVDDYYEKCVENAPQADKFQGYKNDLVPSVSEYKAGLNDQIMAKQVEQSKRKMLNKKFEREVIEKSNEIMEQERKDKLIETQKQKENFLEQNKSIIQLKSRKKEMNVNQKLKEDEIKLKQDQLDAQRISKETKEKELLKKKKLNETLQKQIEDKSKYYIDEQRKEEIKNSKNKPWLNDCNCSHFQTCSVCKKQFPKGILHNRSSSQKPMDRHVNKI